MLSRRRIPLAMMSVIAMLGMYTPGDAPHDVPPFDTPKPLGPPPLTPEQIKAQEKRARRAAKRAQ